MSPAFRGELQALLARKVSEGVPQRPMTVDSMKSPAVADGFARRHPYGSWVEGHGDAALSSNEL
jgi:hypothetical protein